MMNRDFEGTREIRTKEDAQDTIDMLLAKRNQIIEQGPQLTLSIKDGPKVLGLLFEKDGTPKYDFRVSEVCKGRVRGAFEHQSRNRKGEIYFGNLCEKTFFGQNEGPTQYNIKINPLFLTDVELSMLGHQSFLKKNFNGVDITFLAPAIFDTSNFSNREKKDAESIFSINVDLYSRKVEPLRKMLQEIDAKIMEIKKIMPTLPSEPKQDFGDDGPGFLM